MLMTEQTGMIASLLRTFESKNKNKSYSVMSGLA